MENSMFAKLAKFCAFFLLLVVVACGSKVSEDNYGKIKTGMTLEEVKGILGDPTETPAAVGVAGVSAGAYVWKDGDKSITVTLMNDKVSLTAKSGF
jgi:hypothetical protein